MIMTRNWYRYNDGSQDNPLVYMSSCTSRPVPWDSSIASYIYSVAFTFAV